MTACEITIYYIDDFNYIVKLTTTHTPQRVSAQCHPTCSIYHLFHISISSQAMAISSAMRFCWCMSSAAVHIHITCIHMKCMKYDFLVHDHFCLWSKKERKSEHDTIQIHTTQYIRIVYGKNMWVLQDINHKYGSIRFASILCALKV